MLHRGLCWCDGGRQGSCGPYLVADHVSQGRSWLIKRFKRRSLGIIHSSRCIRYLWKFLSVIALICNFRSKKVGVTENLRVECTSGSQKVRFPILLPPNNLT